MIRIACLSCLSLFLSWPVMLIADAAVASTAAKVEEHLAGPLRTDEDRARDASRKPVQTLEYFGFRDDMTVVELFPGSGWYTKILAPVLKDRGKLYLSVGTSRLEPKLEELGLANMVEITGKVEGFQKTDLPGFIFDIDSVNLEVENVDLILTFRNVHNLSAKARKAVNDATFRALKPGGIFGVIGHTKRHMEPFNAETWRRTDPVRIIKEVLDSGFEFAGYSDLHAVAADALVHDTTHDSVNRHSDRFTLKFRKPR